MVARAFDGEITSWRASGKSVDRGGANIDNAPEGAMSVALAGKAEEVPLGPCSCPFASPFGLMIEGLIRISIGTQRVASDATRQSNV